jgi:hypothetical protein
MKYTFEMGSVAIMYIPDFIKIGSGIRKLMGGGGFTDRDLISLLIFFKVKKVY